PVIVPAPADEPQPDVATIQRGGERALASLDRHDQPHDAVISAWLGLQETAEESGITRAAAETPTEFTARIISRALADDRAVTALLRLYLRTRFGDHPITRADVDDARAAL